MQTAQCRNCRFYLPLPTDDSNGICRRNPPTIIHFGEGHLQSHFPPMTGEGWCGEHKGIEK